MATEMSMKLLINKKAGKVLFAEAGKDVIDFILAFLALPVGGVIRLLSHDTMPGSIGKLYQSLQTLNETYMIKGHNKDLLLQPKIASLPPGCNQPLLLQNGSTSDSQFFKCSNCSRSYFTDVSGTPCPSCNCGMTNQMTYVAPRTVGATSDGEGGFVKGVVSYMIMDDLAISPMSTISSITLLNSFNIKDFGALEEKVVKMGKEEGLELLQVSLESKTVLTDVFLGGRREQS